MALINCPECGKEISDKALSCPNCGCPISNEINSSNVQQTTEVKKPNVNIKIANIKKYLPIIIGVVIVAIIGIMVYNEKVVKPKKIEAQNKATYEEAMDLFEKGEYEEANKLFSTIEEYSDVKKIQEQIKEAQNKATYEEAMDLFEKGEYEEANELFSTIEEYSDVKKIQEQIKEAQIEAQNKATYEEAVSLLEKGKYEEANKLFDTIKGYSDVDTIQNQLIYESYAYSAINSLKKNLKNPDSYIPYEINFYMTEETTEETEDNKYPACVMHYGAQNGFGGNTTGYAICTYNSDLKEYEYLGSCDSLDEDDYDEDDMDDVVDLIVCQIINLYREKRDPVGDINLARLKIVLKNDVYSTIKIIE